MAHLLPINKKEFYIELYENRYYFHGDVVKGTVVLNLSKPTKTNHIRITLTGTVHADKTTAQVLQTSLLLSTSPLNDGKPHLLQAKTHRLPFEFNLPNDDDTKLPSSLKLSKSMKVKYVITAIHDRPLIPERLSSVIKKEIRILERIDITQPKYGARGRVTKDVRVLTGLPNSGDKVHLSLTLPQYAVVRGDILPMEIYIKHYRKLGRADGIKVQLIRRVYIGKERKKSESKSITSHVLAMDITPNGGFEQKINTKLLVPTHTPPTVSQNGQILAVEYKARVVVNINDPYGIYPQNHIKLESHVVIGTYPKPNLCIDEDVDDDDDDDDDDNDESSGNIVAGLEEICVSDDDDDNDELVDLVDGDTQPSSDQSTSAHIVELPFMRQQSSTIQQQQYSSTVKQQHRDSRYSPTMQQYQSPSSSSLTVVDPTTSPIPSTQQRYSSTSSSPSLTVVDPTIPPIPYIHQRHSSASSSPSLTVVDPTTPPMSHTHQRHSSASSSPSLTVVDPTTPPITAHQHSSPPPVPAKQQQQHKHPGFQHRQQSSSSSLTVVDPTIPPISSHQHSSAPPVPVKPYPRPVLQQRQQSSSSSSLTVMDPTAPTVSIHTGRRQSYLPQKTSTSAIVIDPTTTTTTTTTDDPRQHTHYAPSNFQRHSLQPQQQPLGTVSVIDPTAKLHRNESSYSALSSLSSTSSSSSGASSSAMLVEPLSSPMMMKPDRNNHSTPNAFTPTTPTPHPMLASMPDITAYIPSKSTGLQQRKRPPLHVNPIATSSPNQQYQQPLSPAATMASPGGFVVPVSTHTPPIYPPPLPPRRPSSQAFSPPLPPPPPPYYQHPPNPWS